MYEAVLSTNKIKRLWLNAFYAEAYQNYEKIISVADIMIDNKDDWNSGILQLYDVLNLNKLTEVSLDKKNNLIKFKSNAQIGSIIDFFYFVKNERGNIDVGRIYVTILKNDFIITNPDTYNLQQWETLYVSKNRLVDNDLSLLGSELSTQSVFDSYGGSVKIIDDNIEFISTDIYGKPAGFKYTCEDKLGNVAEGDVYINITKLPEINSYIWESFEELENALLTIQPTSFKTVFEKWQKTIGNTYYELEGGTESNWTLIKEDGAYKIVSTANISNLVSAVSIEKLANFTFDCNLGTYNTPWDDDFIGLVIAFRRINNVNYILGVGRNCHHYSGTDNLTHSAGPLSGWAIFYFDGSKSTITAWNSFAEWIKEADVFEEMPNWNNKKVLIKIQRFGDQIICYSNNYSATNADDNPILATSRLEIDLSENPELEKFKEPCSYGYCCFSQARSTFINPKITRWIRWNKNVFSNKFRYCLYLKWITMNFRFKFDITKRTRISKNSYKSYYK